MTKNFTLLLPIAISLGLLAGCSGSDADSLGIGAQCTSSDECNGSDGQSCLTNFKGGYCGLDDCALDADCPENSACVTHSDNANYCFRICTDKAQCNENRDPANEANCSASIVFVESQEAGVKACVPPSG